MNAEETVREAQKNWQNFMKRLEYMDEFPELADDKEMIIKEVYELGQQDKLNSQVLKKLEVAMNNLMQDCCF